MPEGDTIFRTAARLHRALGGKCVTRFETRYAHLARVDEDAPIAGRSVERVESRGKHCLFVFSGDLVLRTHLRMRGSWHLYRPGERWLRPRDAMRVRIDVHDLVAIGFDVPDAELVSTRSLERGSPVAALGPDLLGETFDAREALRRLRARDALAIADALLDQRAVAGIGNVFKSEVLFVCGVAPEARVAALDDATLLRLLDCARRLLRANVAIGGDGGIVTWRGLRRTTGRSDPNERLYVYGRAGRPCRRCGGAIATFRQGPDARLTYACARCQPALPIPAAPSASP
jgi:endonuclease-8